MLDGKKVLITGLTGQAPQFEFSTDMPPPSCVTDTAKGREIGLTWKAHWREGMRRMVRDRHPEISLRPAGAG